MKNVIRLFSDILRVDAENRTVTGYAYATADPGDGFILPRAVMEAATPDYLQYANVREMHRASAVGTCTVEWDDTGALMTARIVDDEAWKKVSEGVYKAFSVGVKPKKVKRVGNKTEVLDALWFETSLVDRGADPASTFEIARVEGVDLDAAAEEDAQVDRAEQDFSEFRGIVRGFLMAKLKANEPQTLIREALSCLDSFCWSVRYGEASVPDGMTMRQAFEIAMNDARDYVGPLIDQLPVKRAEGEPSDEVRIEDALRAFGLPDDDLVNRLAAAESSVTAITGERDALLLRVAELESLPDPDQSRPLARAITDEDVQRMYDDMIKRREEVKPKRIAVSNEFETEEERHRAFLLVNRAK